MVATFVVWSVQREQGIFVAEGDCKRLEHDRLRRKVSNRFNGRHGGCAGCGLLAYHGRSTVLACHVPGVRVDQQHQLAAVLPVDLHHVRDLAIRFGYQAVFDDAVDGEFFVESALFGCGWCVDFDQFRTAAAIYG